MSNGHLLFIRRLHVVFGGSRREELGNPLKIQVFREQNTTVPACGWGPRLASHSLDAGFLLMQCACSRPGGCIACDLQLVPTVWLV